MVGITNLKQANANHAAVSCTSSSHLGIQEHFAKPKPLIFTVALWSSHPSITTHLYNWEIWDFKGKAAQGPSKTYNPN
jgi:hypothetical protein